MRVDATDPDALDRAREGVDAVLKRAGIDNAHVAGAYLERGIGPGPDRVGRRCSASPLRQRSR
ncbi:hypothetical protein ACWENQ_16050 [Nonomuraea sp. NPDC004354]